MTAARNLLVLLLACAFSGFLQAQDAAEDVPPPQVEPGKSPLGVRQDRVQRMMRELEQQFVELARTIEKTEPAQAKRLAAALGQSKQALVEGRMGKIAGLLDAAQLDQATADQRAIIAELKRLIQILIEDESDLDRLEAERKRIERLRAQIDQLIKEEIDQKRESERLTDKEQTLDSLEAQAAALEALIARQEQIIRKTAEAKAQGVQALAKIADQQHAVRKETGDLARQIGEPRAGDAAPNEKQSDGSAGKPGEGSAGKPGDGAEGKAGEGSAGKPGAGSEGKPGAGSEGKPGAAAGSEAGQQSLEKAVKSQQAAEEKLAAGKRQGAEADEQAALDQMQRALKEIRKEGSRIASLPPEAFEQMAEKQDATAEKTKGVGAEMAPSGQPGAEGGGEPGESSAAEQASQEQVQKAEQSMRKASGGLKKQQPGAAAKDQKKAVEQLQQAREELEERLAQLRKEMQAEKLAALESRFREMLARQQPVTLAVAALDRERSQGKLRRADRLALVKHSQEERAIGELAAVALEIITEDGTSVVFPHVVRQLRDDFVSASELLRAERTDAYTQHLQREIEKTLTELIDALEKAQENLDSQGEGEAGDDNEPLLPGSAELKLLKAAQLRVNRRTASFEEHRPAEVLDEALKKEIHNISDRQRDVAQMAAEMTERN